MLKILYSCTNLHFDLYLFVPMVERLNDTDRKVYAMIRNRIVHGLGSPTLQEINRVTGKSSPRSAVLALERLEKAGLIIRSGWNKIRLTSESLEDNSSVSTADIPLVGSISAGMPILAVENVEAIIPVSSALAKPGSKYFLLRVVGDSMDDAIVNGAIIQDGSIVLVRQQPTAENGEKVVALINDQATVKIFEKADGVVILRPRSNNTSHMPIILTESCIIQGVVVAVLPGNIN